MKRKILILFIGLMAFSGLQTHAQNLKLYNLFYISKYMTAPDLPDTVRRQVYSTVISNVGVDAGSFNQLNASPHILKFMGDVEKNEVSKLMVTLNKISTNTGKYKDKAGKMEASMTLVRGYLDTVTARSSLVLKKSTERSAALEIVSAIDILAKLNNSSVIKAVTRDSIVSAAGKLPLIGGEGSLTNFKNEIDAIVLEIKEIGVDSFQIIHPYANWQHVISDAQKKTFVDLASQLKTDIETLEKEIVRLEAQKTKSLDSMALLVFRGDIVHSNLGENIKIFESLDSKATTQQIAISSSISAAVQGSASSFRLPSEADVVNAMAIFLADRAKREAMIWLVDQLKTQIKQPLLTDVFPETYKMLSEGSGLSAPDFGSAWRLALSKDLIRIPTNLVDSRYVREKWFAGNDDKANELKELVAFGADFLTLVNAQYNYRDILKHLYLKKYNESAKTNVRTYFDFLYLLVNELYTIDEVNGKSTFRLLTFEELQSLNEPQWDIFINLVKIKYGQASFDFLVNEFNENKLKSKDRNKWIATLLLTLTQFDKLRAEDKENQASGNAPDIWSSFVNIIDQLDAKSYIQTGAGSLNSTKSTSSKDGLQSLRSIIDIYQNLYARNFDMALKETVNLLTSYAEANNIVITLKQNALTLKTPWRAPEFSMPLSKYITGPDNDLEVSVKENAVSFGNIDNRTFALSTIYEELQFLKYYDTKTSWEDWKKGWKAPETISMVGYLTTKGILRGKKDSINFLTVKLIVDLLHDPMAVVKDPFYQQTFAAGYLGHIPEENTQKLIKITSFFTDVLQSSDEKGLASAMEKHFLPPTSYIMKRKLKFSVFLNGYVGVSAGYQHVFAEESQFRKGDKANFAVYGITAPVGVTFSWRNVGIFVQAIELGNLVNHYLWETDTENRPNVYIKEVISPGVNFMYYLKNSPFVLFAGGKLIPLETKLENGHKLNNKAFDLGQITAGIKFDIPFVALAKKSL
ncbi:hypothetical protein [Sphingobacterium sp. LRF_L2]|uniref:hypothetical protein n=1 Tax=Sphingobacterium sp. LRF_L2 TaxID=3369421 RepID=UPI003F5D7496